MVCSQNKHYAFSYIRKKQNFNSMKNGLLKVLLVVIGIIAVAFIVGKAIVEAAAISAQSQLAIAQADNQHKEKMADKFIQYHRQAFGSKQFFCSAPNDFRPSA